MSSLSHVLHTTFTKNVVNDAFDVMAFWLALTLINLRLMVDGERNTTIYNSKFLYLPLNALTET